jgi:hypothetical protein
MTTDHKISTKKRMRMANPSPVSAFHPPNLPPLTIYSQVDQHAHSPEVVLSHLQENLGPCEEGDTEFAKEFAKELVKMVTNTSSELRKVDKKTTLMMWEIAVLPPAVVLKEAGAGNKEAGEARLENGDAVGNVGGGTGQG